MDGTSLDCAVVDGVAAASFAESERLMMIIRAEAVSSISTRAMRRILIGSVWVSLLPSMLPTIAGGIKVPASLSESMRWMAWWQVTNAEF